MSKRAYYLINGITVYRLLASPVLLWLVIDDQINLFKWLLPVSFFTDFIDGWLARKYQVASVFGSRLDSVADDLTVAVGIVGLFLWRWEFLQEQLVVFISVLGLFVIQSVMALFRYGRFTSFHTYMAKLATLLQGSFLILTFLYEPIPFLFYLAAFITAVDLVEEIALTLLLPKWKADIRGIYVLFGLKQCFMKHSKHIKSILIMAILFVVGIISSSEIEKLLNQHPSAIKRVKQLTMNQSGEQWSATSQGDSLSVYPDPVVGNLRIFIPSSASPGLWIGIYNAQGQLLRQRTWQSSKFLEINVKELPAAIYYIKVVDYKGRIWTTAFLKM